MKNIDKIRVGLSFRERELWNAFQAYLNLAGKRTFTADDMLEYFSEDRLKEVFRDPVHDIGLFWLKLLRLGEIRKVGSVIGRYNRAIKEYAKT